MSDEDAPRTRRRLGRWVGIPLALVVLAVALIGLLAVVRHTPIRGVASIGGGTGPAAGTPAFTRTVELLVPARLDAGSHALLLNSGDGTYPPLLRDLGAARRTIAMQVYFWEPGALSDTIGAVLRERARAGVRVLVLFDDFGASGVEEYRDSLRADGVDVAVLRPLSLFDLHKAQQRSHVRAVVIDGAVGYTGGFGVADQWLGDGRSAGHWRDTNVRFTGPAVRQLTAAFAAGWAEANGTLLIGEPFFPEATADTLYPAERPAVRAPAPDEPTSAAGVLHTAPGVGSTAAERLMALSIVGARERLYLTNAYFVPDEHFRRMLIDAARRGVDVRVLVPGERTDVPLTRLASHGAYEELLRGGVRIWEYRPAMIHSKTLVVDGNWSLVGTMNFDTRSLALNDEVVLIARDAGLGRSLERLFLDDLDRSREIRLDTFSRRGWWTRTKERAAMLISDLL